MKDAQREGKGRVMKKKKNSNIRVGKDGENERRENKVGRKIEKKVKEKSKKN